MIIEHHIKTTKTARYYVLGNLETANEVWIACHGYGHSAKRFAKNFKSLVDNNTAVIVPEALHRFYNQGVWGDVGASWMTKEDRENDVSDYVEYLNKLNKTLLKPHQTVQVLGFSQGAATACRWVADGQTQPKNLVLWAGLIPPDIHLSANISNLNKSNLIWAHSPTDQYRTSEMWKNQYDLLKKSGLNYTEFEYEGGHKIPEAEFDRFIKNMGLGKI